MSFEQTKLLILIKSNVLFFSFMHCAFDVISKKLLIQGQEYLSFSSKGFMFLFV